MILLTPESQNPRGGPQSPLCWADHYSDTLFTSLASSPPLPTLPNPALATRLSLLLLGHARHESGPLCSLAPTLALLQLAATWLLLSTPLSCGSNVTCLCSPS